MTNRRKKYTDDLHAQPYDLEGELFDERKPDPNFDHRDLTQLPSPIPSAPLTGIENSEFKYYEAAQEMLSKTAEVGTDSDDKEDNVSEIGGKARRAPVTRQLVQDAGGYSTSIDPRMKWKTPTAFYCRSCGEPIGASPKRLKCEVPLDPCTPEMLDRRGGCQSCREQRAFDRKDARGRGNQPQCCRPQPGQKESRCAKDWRNAMKRWETAVAKAQRSGTEPPPEPQPVEPKWTEEDLRKFRDAEHIAEARAEYERHRPPAPARKPTGVWDLQLRGTGFDSRDDLRKPGWK